jgi:hypothetical protein
VVDEVAGVKPLSDEISGTVFRVFLQKAAMTPTGSPKSSKNFLGKRKNSGVIEFSGKQSLKHGNERYAACFDEVYNCALLQSGVFVALSELLNRPADCFGLKRNFQNFFNLLVGQLIGTTEKFFKHISTGAKSVSSFFPCKQIYL